MTGASEFVVQEAFDTTACLDGSYLSSLTPRTIVRSESSAGALMTTRFAPASRCAAAFSLLVKKPVHSRTISTPSSFHGSFDGSFSLYSGIFTPSITRESSPASTGNFALPWTESYLMRYAISDGGVRSFSATISTSFGFLST